MGTIESKFDREWWLNFIKKNFSFSEATIFKDVISSELVEELRKGVSEMFRSRINRLDINSGFRLYIEGKELSDGRIIDLIKDNKFDNSESIQSYCERVFGKNFGIITNYGEKYSEILAKQILKTVQPLFDIAGIPPWGLELTTFIGNYGWTPLGIHTDNRGENVLHYHLGPGNKKMYVWNEEVYKKEGKGVSNNKNVEPLLKYADEFEFGKGDLYYMPWNKHHIGYSGDFSIGVTLWFNNPTRYDFSKLMLETIQNLYLKNDQSIIESQIDYLNNENTFLDFKNTLDIDDKTLKAPLEDFLNQSYNEYKKCLISNGGWQNSPLRFYKKIDSKKEYFPNLKNKIIKNNYIYNIRTEKVGNRLYIYVRGLRVSFKYFSELVDIIDFLNQEEIGIRVALIIEKFNSLPEEVVLYFLKILINNKGALVEDIELSEPIL
jgi:hypothetical protein